MSKNTNAVVTIVANDFRAALDDAQLDAIVGGIDVSDAFKVVSDGLCDTLRGLQDGLKWMSNRGFGLGKR